MYERLSDIHDLVIEKYETQLIDLQSLLQLIGSGSIEVKLVGALGLRLLLHKYGSSVQGELFHNVDFVKALIAAMISEPNIYIQLEFSNCISWISKTQRGLPIERLAKDCSFPTSMLICMRDCAQKYHTEGKKHPKIAELYIEMISTNLWTACLIA